MTSPLLRHQLASLLEDRGWRWRRGSGVRGWQDPLKPDGELLGYSAAIDREIRREDTPGEEFERAVRREHPFDEKEDDSHRLSGFRGYMS